MKIMHISDLHIGMKLKGFDLTNDIENALEQVISILKKEKVECLIIAGDIYDKSVPTDISFNVLDSFLNKLVDENIITFIIAGNHDSKEKLGYAKEILKNQKIYISNNYDKCMDKITLNDEYGNINFYMLPFFKNSEIRKIFEINSNKDEEYFERLYEVSVKLGYDKEKEVDKLVKFYTDINLSYKAILELEDINIDERNIIISHQFIKKASLSDSELKFIGGLEEIDANVFEKFDYVALGHLHRPQKVLKDTIRYSGTLIPFSISEKNNNNSVVILNLKEKENIDINFVKINPFRKIKVFEINDYKTLDDIIENNYKTNDFVYFKFLNKFDDENIINKISVAFPNLIGYDIIKESEIENIENINLNINPFELYLMYYESQIGYSLDDEAKEYLKKIIYNED